MAEFKRQRIAGDGVSGVDMASHLLAENPHPQYLMESEVATSADLIAHINSETPHNAVLLKADVVTDYDNPTNHNKVVAASAIKDINDRLVDISNSLELSPGAFSAYRLERTSVDEALGSVIKLDNVEVLPSAPNIITAAGLPLDNSYYILNGELFDDYGNKHNLDHLNTSTGIWSSLNYNTQILSGSWVAINNGRLFFKESHIASTYNYTDIPSKLSSKFSQIRFEDESFNTGWEYAVINEGSNISFYGANYSYLGEDPCTILAKRADGLYFIHLYLKGPIDVEYRQKSIQISNDIQQQHYFTVEDPIKVYYMNGSTKTEFSSYKKIYGGAVNYAYYHILGNDNRLYTIGHDDVGYSETTGLEVGTVNTGITARHTADNIASIRPHLSNYNNVFALTTSGSLGLLTSDNTKSTLVKPLSTTVGLISSAWSLPSVIDNVNVLGYVLANNRIYKGRIEGDSFVTTEITSPLTNANRYTDFMLGPVDRISGSWTYNLYAINSGDVYHITSDNTHTKLSTSQDYTNLLGGSNMCIAIRKNEGTSNVPENVLTRADVENGFVNDSAKLISADVLSAFHEAYLTHDHDGRYDDRYLSKSHISIAETPNPHPQYLTTADVETGSVFVKDPFKDCVPIYLPDDGELSQDVLNVYVGDNDHGTLRLSPNTTGTNRVWSGISEYDDNYNPIIAGLDGSNISAEAIDSPVESFSEITGTSDPVNPSSFFTHDGKLFSNEIDNNSPNQALVSVERNNPDGQEGRWTDVTGFNYKVGYTTANHCAGVAAGVGVFNNTAYILMSNGENVSTGINGHWSMLTGSVIYTEASSNSFASKIGAYGICDGDLYRISLLPGPVAEAIKVSSSTYPNLNWSYISSSVEGFAGDAYGIADGKAYAIMYTSTGFNIQQVGGNYSDWVKVAVVHPNAMSAIGLRSNGAVMALYKTGTSSVNITPSDVPFSASGWTDINSGYGIYSKQLFRIQIPSTSSGSNLVISPVTLDGEVVSGWTSITGTTYNNNIAIGGATPVYEIYPVGICDGRAYFIQGNVATLICCHAPDIIHAYGSISKAVSDMGFNINTILVKETKTDMVLSAKDNSHPGKWTIFKSNSGVPISVSIEDAQDMQPWDVTWTMPDTRVLIDSAIGGWKAIDKAKLVEDASYHNKGILKPVLNSGLQIRNGELSLGSEVVKVHNLRQRTVPVYGYKDPKEEIVISSGLANIPLLSKTGTSDYDYFRVWQNYSDIYGSNKVGVINNTNLSILDIGGEISSVEENDNSSISCNFTIISGNLYFIISEDSVHLLSSSGSWTNVSGFYQEMGDYVSYGYGIDNGKLYKLTEEDPIVLDSASTGWTSLCGFSSNLSTDNFYGYGIREDKLYRISNEDVTLVSGNANHKWLRISGIGGTYRGRACKAYGIVNNINSMKTEIHVLDTGASIIPGTSTGGWTHVTGYTYLDTIAYAVQNGNLFKLAVDGAQLIGGVNNISHISGLGYTTSGCCYAISNTQLYAIKNTEVQRVGVDSGWTSICGDYSNAYKRHAYGICNGRIYRLQDTATTELTHDTGWTHIYGRSDVVDYVVCAKFNEPNYILRANDITGKWILEEYDMSTGTYTPIANSIEHASGTDPWNCKWDNNVIVLDVVPQHGWSAVPLSEIGGGGSVSWTSV